MAWPPPAYPVAADKAPGPPSSATEHPDHHNALATTVNELVERVVPIPVFTVSATPPPSPALGDVWFDTTP